MKLEDFFAAVALGAMIALAFNVIIVVLRILDCIWQEEAA